MTKPPPELVEFLYPYGAGIQSLVLGLRTVVLDELAPCHEYIFTMKAKVVLLYGTSRRVIADGICLIAPFAKHVNLGLHHGAELKDPRGLLQGRGKSMRHLRVTALADLDRPALREFLGQARRNAGVKRAPKGAPKDVVTRVKQRPPARPLWPRLF